MNVKEVEKKETYCKVRLYEKVNGKKKSKIRVEEGIRFVLIY